MNKQIFDRRRAGLLIPVYSLRRPGDLGVGDTVAVKQAIDFCADRGFGVLQILPIGETIGDPSPYSPVSSRALSHVLLSMTTDEVPGLTQEMIDREASPEWLATLGGPTFDHGIIRMLKRRLLSEAFLEFGRRGCKGDKAEFAEFKASQAGWLDPYTAFRVLVAQYENDTHWRQWKPEHQTYESAVDWLANNDRDGSFTDERETYAFIQWVALRQWKSVRVHADAMGVRLIGDLTFGISANSVDSWHDPSLFDLEWSMGTRPLAHFDTSKDAERWGQNWGFPPYQWSRHREDGFKWLRGRVEGMAEIFHGCRIDHLRGYFRAYMFPWEGGAKHVEFSALNEAEAAALTGGALPMFRPGPDEDPDSAASNEMQGRELIGVLISAAGSMDLVAEIMGEMPDYMRKTLDDLRLATLTFPQLLRKDDGSIIDPADFRELALVSYGNHDNPPLALLYLHLIGEARKNPRGKEAHDLQALLNFAGWDKDRPTELNLELLEALQSALFGTRARLAVLMISDFLGMPLRFNLPGSYGPSTWNERLDCFLADLINDSRYGPHVRNVSELIRVHNRN